MVITLVIRFNVVSIRLELYVIYEESNIELVVRCESRCVYFRVVSILRRVRI